MGKNKLMTSMVIGAVVGGLVALFDKETRQYASNKLTETRINTTNCMKHPSDTIKQLRTQVDRYNSTFAKNADQAINALEQVGETIDKFQKKE